MLYYLGSAVTVMFIVPISWSFRCAAVPTLLYVVLVNFLFSSKCFFLFFLVFIIIYIGVLRNGLSIFKGDGLVVGLQSRGPSVLLYAHLPQGEFVK